MAPQPQKGGYTPYCGAHDHDNVFTVMINCLFPLVTKIHCDLAKYFVCSSNKKYIRWTDIVNQSFMDPHSVELLFIRTFIIGKVVTVVRALLKQCTVYLLAKSDKTYEKTL